MRKDRVSRSDDRREAGFESVICDRIFLDLISMLPPDFYKIASSMALQVLSRLSML